MNSHRSRHSPTDSFHAAGATHIGRRKNNQDAYVLQPELGLFAVADGMGGYAGGEVASSLAARSVSRLISTTLRGDNVVWPHDVDLARSPAENLVAMAARLADDAIVARRVGELAHMGSTLSMLLCSGDRAVIGHIGDSRIYRQRGRQLTCLTADHTLYAQLVAQGHDMPPPEEYPYSNVITRALGASPPADVETIAIEPGDRFILCTDGLTGPVTDPAIAALSAGSTPSQAAAALVEAAVNGGGSDNITVVVVDYMGYVGSCSTSKS